MRFKARSKLGCQISGLSRMVKRKRQAVNRHPSNPRDPENLTIPPEYTLSSSGESLMLWDSRYSTQTRQSFLWGKSTNDCAMEDAEHWVIVGTLKSAPHLFTQLFTVHGLLPDGWHLPSSTDCFLGKRRPSTGTCSRRPTAKETISLSPSCLTTRQLSTTQFQKSTLPLHFAAASSTTREPSSNIYCSQI